VPITIPQSSMRPAFTRKFSKYVKPMPLMVLENKGAR